MKKVLIFSLGFACFVTTQSQEIKKTFAKHPQVRITNMEERGLFFSDNFFEGKDGEILKQISKEEFEKVKQYDANWPPQMQFDNRFHKDSVARIEFNKKLCRLKMYKVATFRHIFQGTDWGNFVIVGIPYKENKDWDSAARWEGTVYFIFHEKAVEEVL